MAVLPASSPELFAGQHAPVPSKKQIPGPSHATVAAIAAGRHSSPPAASSAKIARPSAPRRTSSASSEQRKGTQEKRDNHNAIERARRDSLNQRFLVLAARLPSLSKVRRPSKSLIVNRSMQFVSEALDREAYYRHQITEMHDRARVLTEQLNDYRLANGLQNYVETVPDLALPIPMADVPKDKPTARIVGRQSRTSLAQDDGLDVGPDEYEEYDDMPAAPGTVIGELEPAYFTLQPQQAQQPQPQQPEPNQHAPLLSTANPFALDPHTFPTQSMDINSAAMLFHSSSMRSSSSSHSHAASPLSSTSPPSQAAISPMPRGHHFSEPSGLPTNWSQMFPMFNLPRGSMIEPTQQFHPSTEVGSDLTSLLGSSYAPV